ncbi:putative ABC transport system ATP-binding protein [Hypnocyclicus thermotrophus]|uniref:ABC transport system ATP-binding protein n=1 Tax=Hypnocyclicus thermotrophus TaxID=1627895 RepID=A0AA46E084_9FUSO|nr:ABC transporter ATP-binding protein [Hypnocyclicus thermotrophus]TDT72374.1 putative ABC transport system ATP-binding protein [Hypnocyclicus thermotrophus]
MSIVKIKKLTKEYHNGKIFVKALKNITLDIKKGEFSVIAGPSGSGKTTLLNIIGAMDKLTTGEIIIDGENISNLSKKEAADFRRRKIGFIFQSYNLIPVLTAYENIELALDLVGGYTKKEKDMLIEEILDQVGILNLKNRKPLEMSGGQQQRVAIARALVKKPAIILADEPTANLDTDTGESILDVMEKLNKELNTTFIFSSHDIMIIERARRIIKLRDGILQN